MKKETLFIQISALLILLSFCSCSHKYYYTNEASLLAISEKNEAKFSGSVSIGTESINGASAQVGYSPLKHLVVGANYQGIKGKNVTSSNGGNQYMIEGVVGFYYKRPIFGMLKEKTNFSEILFDTYTGYGLGNNTHNLNWNTSTKLSFQHYFLQGGVHLLNEKTSFSYALKGLNLNYTTGLVINDADLGDFEYLKNDPFSFLEQSFRVKYKLQIVDIYLTVVRIRNLNSIFKHDGRRFHFGVIYDIDKLFRKNRNPALGIAQK